MSPSPSARNPSPDVSVLVVDDDASSRQTAGAVLRSLNIGVCEAGTGAEAIAAIQEQRFDLALIDFRLPDISGIDIIRELKRHHISIPWLLMSGWMTTPLAVEAMRLGAVDVVQLPFDIESVVTRALRELPRSSAGWPAVPSPELLPVPRCAAERWAVLVLRGCAAPHDLKTIAHWASAAGISYSGLTESCRLVGTRPHDARDFLRMLRALLHAAGRLKDLEHRLDVNDHRTLKVLFGRAGLTGRGSGTISLREFLERQQFVDPAGEGVRLVLQMIAGREASPLP